MRKNRPFTDNAGFCHHCWECVHAKEWADAEATCERTGLTVTKYDSPNNQCSHLPAACEYERAQPKAKAKAKAQPKAKEAPTMSKTTTHEPTTHEELTRTIRRALLDPYHDGAARDAIRTAPADALRVLLAGNTTADTFAEMLRPTYARGVVAETRKAYDEGTLGNDVRLVYNTLNNRIECVSASTYEAYHHDTPACVWAMYAIDGNGYLPNVSTARDITKVALGRCLFALVDFEDSSMCAMLARVLLGYLQDIAQTNPAALAILRDVDDEPTNDEPTATPKDDEPTTDEPKAARLNEAAPTAPVPTTTDENPKTHETPAKTAPQARVSPLLDPRITFPVLTSLPYQWYRDDEEGYHDDDVYNDEQEDGYHDEEDGYNDADKARRGLICNTADQYGRPKGVYLNPGWLIDNAAHILRRVDKDADEQRARTKHRAEVFTPLPVIKRMVDEIYEPEAEAKGWRARVMARDIEIACGEAPFLTTRYDPTTGEPVAEPDRLGILDRKFRAIYENAKDADVMERLTLLYGALTHTYGTELAPDSLLIARANVFLTWYEAFERVMGCKPTPGACEVACEIIVTTIVQVDMITGLVPETEHPAMVGVYDEDEQTPREFQAAFYHPETNKPRKTRKPRRKIA